jgi:putative DNA primase/helicase
MLVMAQSEPGIPVAPDELDRDPWLLTVENGTIDLRTGVLRPHDRADLITKLAPVAFDPAASCPRWLDFLDAVFAGDAALIDFVQRAIGSSLTGITRDRAVFVLFGGGRNGKTTLLEVLRAVLGPEFAVRVPTETLLARRGDGGVPNDVARLRGARFVTAAEAEEGRRLDESKVKELTGGDTLTARFMRSEWFEFLPRFKLWVCTNHKPVIRGTDRAIWDRIRLIPFGVRFWDPAQGETGPPELRADPFLREALMAEIPGILAWAVRGCVDWQRSGLGAPEAVRGATEGYRSEMDTVGRFIADICLVNGGCRATAKDLYGSYVAWCEENGEKPMTQKAMGLRLAERGFDSARIGNPQARCWLGIGLRSELAEGDGGRRIAVAETHLDATSDISEQLYRIGPFSGISRLNASDLRNASTSIPEVKIEDPLEETA